MAEKLTKADVDNGAWTWRATKCRETDASDDAYFRASWEHLPGLRCHVEAAATRRELRAILGEALTEAGRAALQSSEAQPIGAAATRGSTGTPDEQ